MPSSAPPKASAFQDVPERYRGKPMLVIVDNYALSVIGALPPDKDAGIRAIVKRTFGGGDDWRATVRTTMGWPANVDNEILMNWKDFQEKARQQGIAADQVAFAQAFGDEFSKY
jgi:hypothetical protein